MYSFPNLEPLCCSMSSSYCCFLTCIQVSQKAGKVVWCSLLFKSFPQFVVIHTVKGLCVVNKYMDIIPCFLSIDNFHFQIQNTLKYVLGEGNGTPLQYSCLANPMDRGAWWAAVHGVARSRTRLSDFTFTFHFHALEKEMATHSGILAWRIPGMAEPGGLPSMGSHRVGHD